jgi:cell division septum initiation protein DivIVA
LPRVALERQSIEKKDFPIGRSGYDPEAVDSHLGWLADEIEELKRSLRHRNETVASAASDRVRAIVEAAESSAAAIQRQAEEEAQEIRSDATNEAQSTRDQATAQAREYVGKVSESTTGMLQRIDAMESELSALIEALRTGCNRLNADLQLLEGNIAALGETVSPRPQFEPERAATALEPASAPAAAAELAGAETPSAPTATEPGASEPGVSEPGAAEPGAAEPGAAEGAGGSDDAEGARLIALNMALNGTPRDETDRYLAQNFQLADRGRLLDEVYANVEG